MIKDKRHKEKQTMRDKEDMNEEVLAKRREKVK